MKVCKADSCNRKVLARGWCSAHYQRWRCGIKVDTPIKPVGWEGENTKKAVAKPSMADIHWAAGFLEGDGSFTSAATAGKYSTQKVSACQVNEEPIQKLLKLFGGNVYVCKNRRPKQNDTLNWYACGARARGIMLTLYPLVSQKRKEQIRNALTS